MRWERLRVLFVIKFEYQEADENGDEFEYVDVNLLEFDVFLFYSSEKPREKRENHPYFPSQDLHPYSVIRGVLGWDTRVVTVNDVTNGHPPIICRNRKIIVDNF